MTFCLICPLYALHTQLIRLFLFNCLGVIRFYKYICIYDIVFTNVIIVVMKKTLLVLLTVCLCSVGAVNAQKFALIDMEYILSNIPAYEMMNEQLGEASEKWQGEVEAIQQEAQDLYKQYQADLVFLSAEMKSKREEEIIKKEQDAQELKRKYFGPEGELYKRREALMRPIQDEIYEVIKEISEAHGYQLVIDRASAMSVIFASPKIDISNEVLTRLGYSK